jgi:predicted nucleic acid-binding Zn finger protein
LEFLTKAKDVVDAELDRIDLVAKKSDDPDSFAVYDEFEYVLGVGFVACQTYIASKLRGKNKTQSLSLGPMHRSQQSFAVVTNACANYWKHHDEWDRASLKENARRTISVLEAMGADVWSEYPTSNVMHALLSPHELRFKKLLPFLKQWAERLHNAT